MKISIYAPYAKERFATAQAGLRSCKHEKFKVLAVIVDWDTPLAIMILEHQRIIDADPGAPFFDHMVVH
jgi:hypothetical protein